MNKLKKCTLCKVEYKRYTHTCADPNGNIFCSECKLKFRTTRCMFKHVKYAHAQPRITRRSASPILVDPASLSILHTDPTTMGYAEPTTEVKVDSITFSNPPSPITLFEPVEHLSETSIYSSSTLIDLPSDTVIEQSPLAIMEQPTCTTTIESPLITKIEQSPTAQGQFSDPNGRIFCFKCKLKFRTTRSMFKHVKAAHSEPSLPTPILEDPTPLSVVYSEPTTILEPSQPIAEKDDPIIFPASPSPPIIEKTSTPDPIENITEPSIYSTQPKLILSSTLLDLPKCNISTAPVPTTTVTQLKTLPKTTIQYTKPSRFFIPSSPTILKLPIKTLIKLPSATKIQTTLPMSILGSVATTARTETSPPISIYSTPATTVNAKTFTKLHSPTPIATVQLQSTTLAYPLEESLPLPLPSPLPPTTPSTSASLLTFSSSSIKFSTSTSSSNNKTTGTSSRMLPSMPSLS